MASFCPGSRGAGRGGAAGCPVRLGSSLRPRAMMARANTLRRSRRYTAAALVLNPPTRFLPLRMRRVPK
eukprot:9296891-Alexandrium_andersonii.AAC.1